MKTWIISGYYHWEGMIGDCPVDGADCAWSTEVEADNQLEAQELGMQNRGNEAVLVDAEEMIPASRAS